MLHQRNRRRIQIHTDTVHTVLNHAVERLSELLLIHIMLILTDSDRFRINLHELCQRILYPAGDRSRASLSDIKIREFLRSQFTRRINRSPRLICDHVRYLLRNFLEQLHNNLFGLTGSRAISKRNQ